MRDCIVTKIIYYPPQANLPNGKSEPKEPVDAVFHQFVTETDDDGRLVTMALVEFEDGSVEQIPLHWLKLKPSVPMEAAFATLEASPCTGFMSESTERHIMEVFNIGLHQFTNLCQNLAARR